MNETPRWLVTGGCGFIGKSLIRRLLKDNPATHIRVLDNLSVGTRQSLRQVTHFREVLAQEIGTFNDSVELIVGDIRDKETVESCCDGIDVIVHLAANTGVAPSVAAPRQDMESNVIGTFNVLEGARSKGVTRFIFASSGAPVGDVDPPIHEKIAPRPVSPYGASKLAGEGYCSAYFRTFGIKAVALRFGNVYGPDSFHKESVIARFIKRALDGEPLEIYGDGSQTRDFIYIEDLIDALLRASSADVGGEVFQIATHRETTVGELAESIKALMERAVPTIPVSVKHCEARIGDVQRNFSDTTKAREVLGWESRWTLERGLRETLDWFLENRFGLRPSEDV